MARVAGKVALVTGASLGIGRAAALMLAREGASVVVGDINVDEGRQVVSAIEAQGGKAVFALLDVQKEEDWQAAIALTVSQFGRLDIAVNNAGIAFSGTVESTTLAEWRHVQAINLDGVFLGTQYAIEAMRRHDGGGSIINLSSIEGLIGDPRLAAYNASKGGVRLFTKSSALHCAKNGYRIRVNSIHPGYIWTPMVQRLAQEDPHMHQKLIDLHPVGHLGEADDIAYGILYLASDESRFMTGSELVIDGGYTAQ